MIVTLNGSLAAVKSDSNSTAFKNGQKLEFGTLCRVDVPAELDYIKAEDIEVLKEWRANPSEWKK